MAPLTPLTRETFYNIDSTDTFDNIDTSDTINTIDIADSFNMSDTTSTECGGYFDDTSEAIDS